MEEKLFLCPRSGKPIKNPVILDHKKLMPLIYDKESVIAALDEGELKQFNINQDNLKYHTDHFSLELLQRIAEERFTIDINVEERLGNLECPISMGFPMKRGVLCLRDGRTYEFDAFYNAYKESPTSPINRSKIKLERDLIIHPVHRRILQRIEAAPSMPVDLIEILNDFQQPIPEYIIMPKEPESTLERSILLSGTVIQLLPIQLLNFYSLLSLPGQSHNYLLPIAAEYSTTRYQLALVRRALKSKEKYGISESPLITSIFVGTAVAGVFIYAPARNKQLLDLIGEAAPLCTERLVSL